MARELAQYDLDIIPIKGKTNVVADRLSRQKILGHHATAYSKELL